MVWFLPNFKKSLVFKSKINGDITIKKRYGKPAVVTGLITQSGGEIYSMWEKVIKELSQRMDIRNCLMLGVGGGTAIQLLKQYFPIIEIVGVELDPVMIRIAKNYFELKNLEKVTLIEDDAITYVRRKVNKKYDLILIDLYIGELNPPQTRKKEFMRNIERFLPRSGVILYNAHYQGEKGHKDLLNILEQKFSVKEVFSYPLNRVLLLYN